MSKGAWGRRCGDVGRFKARAGWESRNYSKYLETRRNATRGACYRWQIVVSNASVLCGLVAMNAPASLGCLSALPSSWCVALHPIPPPPHPPGQVCRVTLVLVRATVSVSGLVVVDVGFAFLLLCSMHHDRARPPSSPFWSCPLAHEVGSTHPRRHHSVV